MIYDSIYDINNDINNGLNDFDHNNNSSVQLVSNIKKCLEFSFFSWATILLTSVLLL